MATNSYFTRQKSERNVVEDLTIESIKIHGLDMVYIPRTLVKEDELFGEDTLSKFTQGNFIEMYVESADGFEGDGDFLSKFGLEIKDSVSLIVAKKRFEEVMGGTTTKPREGDLVYFPMTKGLFEIKFVEHENPFYQLGKLYTYKLSCELFTYSHEEIDTGFSDVDEIEDNRKEYAVELSLGGKFGNTADFYAGEVVYQGADGLFYPNLSFTDAVTTAKVVDWNLTNKILTVTNIVGTLNQGGLSVIRGKDSWCEYALTTRTTTNIITPTEGTADVAGDNEMIEFEIDSDGIFDFTDIDPFSEGNYS